MGVVTRDDFRAAQSRIVQPCNVAFLRIVLTQPGKLRFHRAILVDLDFFDAPSFVFVVFLVIFP